MKAHGAVRAFIAVAVIAITCLGAVAPTTAATRAPGAVVAARLSPVGDRAVADLRECLSSNSSLDVFYLLDASGSLFKQTNQAGTDPDFVRADLIANSLRQLSGLQEGLQVSYGLGFFGTDYRTAIKWRSVDPESIDDEASRLRKTIRDQESMDWTNWLGAVAGAQQQLASRKAQTNGCQVLVWLTDGGINLDGYNEAKDNAALNSLCGEKVRPGSKPASGGAFNELRQSGVVVFGVLLRAPGGKNEARDKEYGAYMKPLVEGEGAVSSGQITCGTHPIPESYVAGAYLEATSASDLAQVFLSLGAVVSGGYPAPFDADGGFDVDPGISRFRIVTGAQGWTLAGPNGIEISAGSSDAGVVVEDVGGANSVQVDIDDQRVGHWTWTSKDAPHDELYFYSGLQIKLDTPGTFLAGADNLLTGTISRTDDRAVPLNAYDFELRLSIASGGTVSPIDTGTVEVDYDTGEFTFHYSALEASGVLTLEADIDNLRSLPSGNVLADVASRLDVTVTLPDQYPSVSPQPLKLSDLVGADGRSTGTWTITAPRDGTEGTICFPSGSNATIISDAADRSNSWQWNFDGPIDGDGCVSIGSGTSDLTITARNPVAAYSDVSAVLPVVYRSGAGDQIEGSLPMSLSTTRPINVLGFFVAVLLLLAAGILVPLALLWLVNRLTHKITQGRELLRASMPVKLDADGDLRTLEGVSLREYEWDMNSVEFKGSTDSSRYVDGELGTVRAKVPLFPLGRPWYEIEASGSKLLFGPADFLPVRRRKAEARGLIASFAGDLGKAWGFVVDKESVKSRQAGEDLAGTFVVWARNTDKDASVFYGRIAEIFGGESLTTRVARAVDLLRTDRAKRLPRFSWPWLRPRNKPAASVTVSDPFESPPPSTYGDATELNVPPPTTTYDDDGDAGSSSPPATYS